MKTDDYSYCQVIGITDRGLKRAANEDWLGERKTPNGWVAVVCDGMGGHVGGAAASHIAVEAILDFLSSEYFEDPRIAIGRAIDTANAAIQRKAMREPELQGMGSTCVLLIVRDGKVYIGHVGDSRIYLIRDHRIHQLTKDHSYVQMLVDMGEITPEQAEHHPRKNEITNALGIPQMQPATVMQNPIDPQAGDCFLLCSDGLSGMVDAKTIEHVVSQQMQLSAPDRAAKLVEKAKEGGGLDNITVQLVEFGATPVIASADETPVTRKWWFWTMLVVLICAIAAFACVFLFGGEKDENQAETAAMPAVKTEQTINLGYLKPQSDTVLLLSINTGNSDTSTVIFRDANNGYQNSIENVAWRNVHYDNGKISVNYDAMPVNGKINGVVRVANKNVKAFSFKFESADCIYTIEVDVDYPQPKPAVAPNSKPSDKKKETPASSRSHRVGKKPAEKDIAQEIDTIVQKGDSVIQKAVPVGQKADSAVSSLPRDSVATAPALPTDTLSSKKH